MGGMTRHACAGRRRDSAEAIDFASPAPIQDKIGSALEAIPPWRQPRGFASRHHHLRRSRQRHERRLRCEPWPKVPTSNPNSEP